MQFLCSLFSVFTLLILKIDYDDDNDKNDKIGVNILPSKNILSSEVYIPLSIA